MDKGKVRLSKLVYWDTYSFDLHLNGLLLAIYIAITKIKSLNELTFVPIHVSTEIKSSILLN